MKETQPERDLLRRHANGDPGAFSTLYDHYHSELYIFALSLLQDSQSAADILQDLFFDMAKQSHRYFGAENFKAYVYRSLRNLASNFKRSGARYREALQRSRRDKPNYLHKAPAGFFSSEVNLGGLQGALSRLDEDQRSVILLHVFENMSFRAMEERLGVSEKTLFSRYQSALKSLKRMIEEKNHESI